MSDRLRIPGNTAVESLYARWLQTPPRPGATVVEVGTALGKSLSYLVDRLIEMGRRDVHVYAVDSWCGSARNGEQQRWADQEGGDFSLYAKQMLAHDPEAFEMIRPLRIDSVRAAECFRTGSGAEIDLAVIDAGHQYDDVCADIEAWLPRVKRGGIIAGDDYDPVVFEGVVRAVNERFPNCHEVMNDNPWRWSVWWHEKPL